MKDPRDFRLIGKQAKRRDTAARTNASARFAQDVFLPGMLVTAVAYPPRSGRKVKPFDASRTYMVKVVVDVKQISQDVAVLANDT